MSTNRIQARETLGPLSSEDELAEVVAELSGKMPDSLILYRGQTENYETVRSGRSRREVIFNPEIVRGWNALVGRMLSAGEKQSVPSATRQAVLQHYGMATHFLDLTSDPNVAAWFAINKFRVLPPFFWVGNSFRVVDSVKYEPSPDGVGYVLVLAIPRPEALKEADQLIFLSDLDRFIRPKRQSAVLLYDRPPIVPDPNEFWQSTVLLDRNKFRSRYQQADLFPSPKIDSGYAGLLSVPYVQVPDPYLSDPPEPKNEDEPQENQQRRLKMWQHGCFAARAISVFEYVENGQIETGVDHKWEDYTLYEPCPVRMWKGWHFDLSDLHPGVTGDVANAAKVTISPAAWQAMLRAGSEVRLEWPGLGNDDVFFTQAVIDHDKVIDHGPPYEGLWLHRAHELIIEQGMISDEEVLTVTAGHGYLLQDFRLRRQTLRKGCKCDHPESHEVKVRAALSMTELVRCGVLALLPHPMKIPEWYVLI